MKILVIKILLVIGLGFMGSAAFAQIDPTDSLPGDPGGLTIYTVQNMSFGAFSIGNSGGTVAISNNGTRSVTGDVLGLNMGTPYFHAIFDVDGPQGAIVSILNGPDVTLTGSNGGSMSMHIGNSDPSSPFLITVAQPARTQVNIGGTLTVGNAAANPPGNYSGTFYITFNVE
ncbi:MAG: DUF4402 domain-containing protein [Ferruginibacter sp.]